MANVSIGARGVAAPRTDGIARWYRGMGLALVAYAAVAAVTVPLWLSDDPHVSWLGFLVASALPLVGLLVGVRLFQPASVAPWLLLWAGQVAFFIGDVLWFGDAMEMLSPPWTAVTHVAYLAGYPLTALGLALFIHHRLPDRRLAPLVDAVAVGVAGAMVLWLVHVEPVIHDRALDPGEMLVILGYPIADVLLLGAVTYLVLAGRTTGAASRLLAVSLVCLLLADVSTTPSLSGPTDGAWVDVLWALSYVLMGAVALVPSMRELTEPATARTASRRHEVLLFAALLVILATAIVQLLLVGHLDAEVILLAAVVLGALLLVSTMDAAREAARRERRWATMLAKASDSFAITAADGTLTYVSPASEHIMKAPSEHRIGSSVMRFERMVHPADQAGPGARLAEAMRTPGAVVQERLRVRLSDGSLRWLEILARNLVDDPDVKGVVFNYRDITGEVEANQGLEDRDRLLAAAEALAQVGSVEWRSDSGTYVSSPGMWALLGVEPGSLPMDEDTLFARVHPDDVARVESAYARLLKDRLTTSLDFRIVRPDGSHVSVHGIGKVESADDGRSERVITTFRDVTEERRLEAEALRSARQRSLIAQTMRGIDSDASPEAVAEIVGSQLSRLSGVATTGLFIFGPDQRAMPYGFTVGGEPITAFGPVPRRRSGQLLERARRGPWIATWNDRPWHPYNKVFMDAGVAAIAYAPVHHGSDVIGFLHLSCSGEDASDTLATHLPALVQFADIAGALLGARLTELNASEATRQGISRVIDRSAFIPVFQPIVDIKRGEVVGYEGLTRFRDQVRPDLKFAEAERAGMGRELELATLRAAVAASRDLPETGWLDLNVSPRLIMEGSELVQALRATERPIVLEVTEHEEIDDYERFRSAADRLGRDVRIAVDDAGSGYASLRHILELRPALVKLDRALIMGIESDQARRALVAGMRQFAGDVDIQLIAEGIETQAELETLRGLDIELGQGYLLGRPRPARRTTSARHAAARQVA